MRECVRESVCVHECVCVRAYNWDGATVSFIQLLIPHIFRDFLCARQVGYTEMHG